MKIFFERFLLTILSLLFSIQTFALDVNDFTFKHLTHSDGLCSQRIYSIKQTKVEIQPGNQTLMITCK